MDILQAFIIVGFAGLIHATFQLSVSVLTLLSGHSLGKKHSHKTLLGLIGRFVSGVGVMTVLIISTAVLVGLNLLTGGQAPPILWAGVCGLLMGLGISVWLFYYQPGPGTELWLPRNIAQFISDRIKKAKRPSEAFSLGLVSVLAEIAFLSAPVLVTALVLIQLPPAWQLIGVGLYSFVASLPLLIISSLIAGGHSIASIQKWREQNKRFLQFISGATLIVLGFYLYVDQISTLLAFGV